MLRKSDEALDWTDYRAIFNSAGCTATYEEAAYFLPHVFAYLLSDAEAHECSTSVIHFMSTYADRLAAESLPEPCRDAVRAWFDSLTKDFTVHHEDGHCHRFGRCLEHGDVVANSDLVTGLIDDLLRYKTHQDLAESLIRLLADELGDAVRSAWLIEYAKETRETWRFHSSGEDSIDLNRAFPLFVQLHDRMKMDMTPVAKSEAIWRLVHDSATLQRHLAVAKESGLMQTTPPTYWQDTAAFLGLRLVERPTA